MARTLLVLVAILAPVVVFAREQPPPPALILAPAHGDPGADCTGRVAALGAGFPVGAGVVLYAMKWPGASLRLANIRTAVATVVVERDGRFAAAVLGPGRFLCGESDGTTVDIVAAIGTSFDDRWPRDGVELTRATFVIDARSPLPRAQRCFAATLLCVRDPFLDFWLATGGLARHGFPLTGEILARADDGQGRMVQYFERSRLEYHPERAPGVVRLGQFGRQLHPAAPPTAPRPGATYFPETGHTIAHPPFAAYWQANGGLAQFGYPLDEEAVERLDDGREYIVQWFELARFEWHPENPDPRYQVVLGQLGRRILADGGP